MVMETTPFTTGSLWGLNWCGAPRTGYSQESLECCGYILFVFDKLFNATLYLQFLRLVYKLLE